MIIVIVSPKVTRLVSVVFGTLYIITTIMSPLSLSLACLQCHHRRHYLPPCECCVWNTVVLAQVAVKSQHLEFFMIIIIMNSIHVYLDGDHDAGDGDDRLEGDANLGGDAHLMVIMTPTCP